MSPSVLIVEDDPIHQRTLEHMLAAHEERGALEVRYVTTADEARAELRERKADVLVCDLYLPKLDGFALANELRQIGAARVLLMGAGQVEPEQRARARALLDAPVYSKPLELPELVLTILAGGEAPPPRPTLPEAGSLAERSVARVLLDIWEERRTGELTLTRRRVRKQIAVRRGAPVGVASNVRAETLGHLLSQRGRITDAQHQEAIAITQRTGSKLGAVLVQLGLLTERALLDELAAQLRHKVVSTLHWADGEYAFADRDASTGLLELPFETPHLVFTGLRRGARLDDIVSRLRATPARIALTLRAERHRKILAKLFSLDDLAQLDRRPIVGELIQQEDAGDLLTLCDVLLRSGCAELERLPAETAESPARDPLSLVELGRDRGADAPLVRSADTGLLIDIDLEAVIGTFDERAAERAAEPAREDAEDDSGIFSLPNAAPAEPAPGSEDAAVEALRKQVLAEYLSLHAKDHYQLLGLPRDAATQDVHLAHAALSRRLQLDRASAADLGRDYARLEEIGAHLRLAYETLTSPERRAAYDRALPAVAPPGDQRLTAEVLSHEGLARLQRGDHAGARDKLRQAVAGDGEQPDYHALLGWTTYLAALGPGRESAAVDRIRAAAEAGRPHLQAALGIDPEHADAREFLGRIEAACGDDASAATHLEVALDRAPTRAEALTTIEAALGRRGEWHRLERLYRRLIHRLADDPSERPLRLWWPLAELSRTRLGNLDAARVAFECVARLAPDDPRPQRALSELLAGKPASWQEAVQALRETWRLEPEDPTPARSLFAAHVAGERWDAALVTAAALACRGALDEASSAYLKQHRPRFLVRAQETLAAPLVEGLRHPHDDAALGTLLTEVFAVSTPEVPMVTLGVGPADLVPAEGLPDPFARTLTYVAHLLAVAPPAVYVRRDFGEEIHVGAARPPLLLVGPKALATPDLLRLAFRLGRALSYLWPGRALAGGLSSNDLKEHLGAALTLAHPGIRFEDPDGRVASLRARLSGRATSLAHTLRPHVDALINSPDGRVHLGRFVAGLARTADRVGLVACNDLPTAARIVDDECAPGAEDELIDFALGETYLAIRARLGLAIAV